MTPTIKRQKLPCANDEDIIRWVVESEHGRDVCETFFEAIRYWLWHCGVPARMAFWSIYPPRRPEYYKLVTIEYIDHIMGELVTTNAWLAVDDDGHYIWTLDDNITVIDDDDVLDWRYM
jgi:hypothetical protein